MRNEKDAHLGTRGEGGRGEGRRGKGEGGKKFCPKGHPWIPRYGNLEAGLSPTSARWDVNQVGVEKRNNTRSENNNAGVSFGKKEIIRDLKRCQSHTLLFP